MYRFFLSKTEKPKDIFNVFSKNNIKYLSIRIACQIIKQIIYIDVNKVATSSSYPETENKYANML